MRSEPDVFIFNPTCEYAVGSGNAWWQPNRLLQKMETDLAALPMFFAQPADIVLTDTTNTPEFISSFSRFEYRLPQFFNTRDFINETKLKPIALNRLMPWGWSPAAHRLLLPLKNFCSDEFKASPVLKWHHESKELYSRRFAIEILKQLLSNRHCEFFIPEHFIPEICTVESEIEKLIIKWGRVMVKAPWSCSGRGLQPVTKTPVHPKVWEKIRGIINNQGFVTVEPYLDKAADLAFQFEIKKGKISFIGVSNFFTDYRGQYQGNFIHGIPPNKYDNETIIFLKLLSEILVEPITETLENSRMPFFYEGNFGVDTLIFRDEEHRLKVNPCLEINLRQNMGLLALRLGKLVSPNKPAVYRIFYRQGKSFLEFKNEMTKKHPPKFVSGKLDSGFFALTQVQENTQFGAYLLIIDR
ncbi:MAG: hypothetical protein LBV47_05325 [Bacteroidales bacterium]|jgi:hypothetical protein|nr:hypothetical protein [Bacteroidales bacterium]